ncbi:MAG TPA: PadR family transcriptional regulator [Dehalococcoidia bacterium]|nr:PadR family transcriptional regulator [Dehalococcoidia bacterium]
MSLKHALLGILGHRPMSGYEVKQFFDSSVQHFWNAELSQIYPTLKGLEEAGFVAKHVEFQENRPNRKVYEITDAGRAEFRRWVRETPPPAGLRDPFMVKVFFGTQVPLEDLLIVLRRQMEEHQKLLAFSETVLRARIREGMEHHEALRRDGVFWSLTLDMAMSYRRAYIAWCEESMRMLEQMVPDAAAARPGTDADHPASAATA